MESRNVRPFLALMLSAAFAGCSPRPSDLPTLREATGSIRLDGQPVQYAKVTFRCVSNGTMSIGATDKTGRFRMLYNRDYWGAPVGENLVTVETGRDLENRAGTSIPARYGRAESSGLTALVSADGPNEFSFELAARTE